MLRQLYNSFIDKKTDILLSVGEKFNQVSSFKIIRPEDEGEIVLNIKPLTEETLSLLKIYDYLTDGFMKVKFPAINLMCYKNATIFENSDVVLTENKNVVWSKYYWYNFSNLIYSDSCVKGLSNGKLYVKKPKKIHKENNVFSLIGVHSHIWSHSLSDYYPRLAYLGEVLEHCKGNLTVVIPEYKDQQLREIVFDIINKYPQVKVLTLKQKEAVQCANLYYIERLVTFTDREISVSIGDSAHPKLVADILQKQLINPLLARIKEGEEPLKLFLPRRGMMRNLKNYKEVEDYFRSEGFYFLEEPHKLSLDEKVSIFNRASIIVGPFGSAFSNIMFSKPGTKVLIFNNYHKAYEYWFSMHVDYFGIDILQVTGYDDRRHGNPAHCPYYIPAEKIIEAYKKYSNQ